MGGNQLHLPLAVALQNLGLLLAPKIQFQKHAIGFAEKQLLEIDGRYIIETIVNSMGFEPSDESFMVATIQRNMMDRTGHRAGLGFTVIGLLHLSGIDMEDRAATVIVKPLHVLRWQWFRTVTHIEIEQFDKKFCGSGKVVGDDIDMIERIELHFSASGPGRVR